MKDETQILSLLDSGEAGDLVLATVISAVGSVYRREGAKMILDSQGRFHGMISGGCLEPELAHSARDVLRTGRPLVRHFDFQEEPVWGLALGCGGRIDVLLEVLRLPVSPLRRWLAAAAARERSVRAVVFESEQEQALGCSLILVSNRILLNEIPGGLGVWVEEMARRLLSAKKPRSQAHEFETARVFFDVVVPDPELAIFGAGEDARPVCALARRLGFAVTVVDARPEFARQERFPGARLLIRRPDELGADDIYPESRVLIMNHHMDRDFEALRLAVRAHSSYIGVLGPRHRFEKLLARLEEEGIHPDAATRDKMHNPAGLNLGAEGPEQIAVSILAELLALENGAEAGFLKDVRN